MPPPVPETPKDPYEQIETLWYTNPREAVRLIREDVINQVTTAYRKAESDKEVWNNFYAVNPELRNHPRDHISRVIQQHSAELNTMSPEAGMKRIGELVKQNVLAMAQAFVQTAEPQPVPGLVAGAAPQAAAEAAPAEEEMPQTLSAAIRARRAERRRLNESKAGGVPRH